MSVLTQGTQVYALVPTVLDPSIYEVLNVECPTDFDPGTSPADEIEDTCLDETDSRTYKRGLRSPSEATLTINADPRNASHVRLFELSQGDSSNIKWAVGWSDGKDIAPSAVQDSSGDFDLDFPAARTWYVFEGYIADFPFSFEGNSVVSSAITIRRSGPALWIPKV